jgi:hypothetical protein
VSDTATSGVGPNAGTIVSKGVSCTGGKVLTGGGAQVTTTGGNDGKVALSKSFPSSAGANGTWQASGVAISNINNPDTFTLTVYAMCA